MGVSSNLKVILPQKHLNDQLDQEFSLFVGPAMEFHDQGFQASTRGDHDHELRPKRQSVQEHDEEEHQEIKHRNATAPAVPLGLTLKIKIPSYKEVEGEKDDSNDGLKTPTSPENKIPVFLPPAPRKPKPRPSTKRKSCRPQILLDVSQEIESLFSTPFAVALGPAGGKNKKVKLSTN